MLRATPALVSSRLTLPSGDVVIVGSLVNMHLDRDRCPVDRWVKLEMAGYSLTLDRDAALALVDLLRIAAGPAGGD